MASSITENLNNICRQISQYEKKYARIDTSVRLIAVSKTHPAARIMQAYEAGQRDFGENYLQEALEKMQELASLDITWHFIGPIQSNKTQGIAENFDWVHSLDRIRIARRLNEQRPDSLPPLNVLLQVNISGEDSKSGVAVDALPGLAEAVSGLPRLALSGLMAIPAPTSDPASQRQSFHRLRMARDALISQGFDNCRHLSMGMSGDFEAAIAEGATMVRIGTDIFGPRQNVRR